MGTAPAALVAEFGLISLVGARDPGSTRVVYAVVIALALLGVALAAFVWWLVRTTRPDPELLAPLEVMQTRRWRKLDPAGRRRLLDEYRPDGAEPEDPAPRRPDADDSFDVEPAPKDVRELGDDHWQRWDRALGLLPPVPHASDDEPPAEPADEPTGDGPRPMQEDGAEGPAGATRRSTEADVSE